MTDARRPGRGALAEPQVSVVMPIFGTSHRSLGTISSVVRAWCEQDVPCEVVVGATDVTPVRVSDDVVASGQLRVVRGPTSLSAPGRLRNLAASVSRAPFLYLADSDVVPLGRDYLRRAFGLLSEGAFLTQPWMYRLLAEEGPEKPGDWAVPGTSRSPATWQPPATRACFVRLGSEGTLWPVEGERFVRKDRGLVRLPRGVERESDPWEQRVLSHFAWGHVLTERTEFEAVGGYCEGYEGWGCEDDDLLLKLLSRRPGVRAWQTDESLSCVHFEHPRPYGGPALLPNLELMEQRQGSGVAAMITVDSAAASRRRAAVR